MKKFLINLLCFSLGVIAVSYIYSEAVEYHQTQYEKCLDQQPYTVQWDCHCYKSNYLANPVMRIQK